MKISYISNFFPPESDGGIEVNTFGIAKEMQKKGWDVSVIAAGKWEEGKKYIGPLRKETFHNISVTRFDINWRLAKNPFTYIYDNPVIFDKVINIWTENPPDVVHVMSTMTLSASVIDAAVSLQIPVLITLHDYLTICPRVTLIKGDQSVCDGVCSSRDCLLCMIHNEKIYQWPRYILPENAVASLFEKVNLFPVVTKHDALVGRVGDYAVRRNKLRNVLGKVQAIILPSPFLMQIFEKNGLPPEKFKVIEEGIDTSWYTGKIKKKPSEVLRVGYIGQIVHHKGIHVLIDAIKQISDPVTLKIYGNENRSKDYSNQLKNMIGKDARIQFCGKYPHEDLELIFSEIDVLVVPSIWEETFCITVREALVAGVPVLGSRIGGIQDAIIPEINGFLFEPGNIEELSELVNLLIKDKGLLSLLAESRKPIRSISDEADELEQEYRVFLQ